MCRTEEFNVKQSSFDRIFKVFFNRVVDSNVEHVINKEKEAEPLVVIAVLDKVGWFRWGLEKTLGIKPFEKFNIPVFGRVDKAIDAFVKEKWYTKVFCIFLKVFAYSMERITRWRPMTLAWR